MVDAVMALQVDPTYDGSWWQDQPLEAPRQPWYNLDPTSGEADPNVWFEATDLFDVGNLARKGLWKAAKYGLGPAATGIVMGANAPARTLLNRLAGLGPQFASALGELERSPRLFNVWAGDPVAQTFKKTMTYGTHGLQAGPWGRSAGEFGQYGLPVPDPTLPGRYNEELRHIIESRGLNPEDYAPPSESMKAVMKMLPDDPLTQRRLSTAGGNVYVLPSQVFEDARGVIGEQYHELPVLTHELLGHARHAMQTYPLLSPDRQLLMARSLHDYAPVRDPRMWIRSARAGLVTPGEIKRAMYKDSAGKWQLRLPESLPKTLSKGRTYSTATDVNAEVYARNIVDRLYENTGIPESFWRSVGTKYGEPFSKMRPDHPWWEAYLDELEPSVLE